MIIQPQQVPQLLKHYVEQSIVKVEEGQDLTIIKKIQNENFINMQWVDYNQYDRKNPNKIFFKPLETYTIIIPKMDCFKIKVITKNVIKDGLAMLDYNGLKNNNHYYFILTFNYLGLCFETDEIGDPEDPNDAHYKILISQKAGLVNKFCTIKEHKKVGQNYSSNFHIKATRMCRNDIPAFFYDFLDNSNTIYIIDDRYAKINDQAQKSLLKNKLLNENKNKIIAVVNKQIQQYIQKYKNQNYNDQQDNIDNFKLFTRYDFYIRSYIKALQQENDEYDLIHKTILPIIKNTLNVDDDEIKQTYLGKYFLPNQHIKEQKENIDQHIQYQEEDIDQEDQDQHIQEQKENIDQHIKDQENIYQEKDIYQKMQDKKKDDSNRKQLIIISLLIGLIFIVGYSVVALNAYLNKTETELDN